MIQTEVWSHNVCAWVLEDLVEVLDPVVGHLPKNNALNPEGKKEEMFFGVKVEEVLRRGLAELALLPVVTKPDPGGHRGGAPRYVRGHDAPRGRGGGR